MILAYVRVMRFVLLLTCAAACHLSHERPHDGGVDAVFASPDASVPPDAGFPSARECSRDASTTYEGPGCTDEMRACLADCSPDECWDCYLRHPDCFDCEYFAYAACTVDHGCQELWDSLACCMATRCSGVDVLSCEESFCTDEFIAFESCGERFFDECVDVGSACGAR